MMKGLLCPRYQLPGAFTSVGMAFALDPGDLKPEYHFVTAGAVVGLAWP